MAACVNIVGPIRSVYRWKEKIEHEEEYLLLIKTTAEAPSGLQAAFQELHPYELPECVELAIDGGSEAYLAWLTGEVGGRVRMFTTSLPNGVIYIAKRPYDIAEHCGRAGRQERSWAAQSRA